MISFKLHLLTSLYSFCFWILWFSLCSMWVFFSCVPSLVSPSHLLCIQLHQPCTFSHCFISLFPFPEFLHPSSNLYLISSLILLFYQSFSISVFVGSFVKFGSVFPCWLIQNTAVILQPCSACFLHLHPSALLHITFILLQCLKLAHCVFFPYTALQSKTRKFPQKFW